MSNKRIVLINLGGTITSVHTQAGGLQSGSLTGAELLKDMDLSNLAVDLKIKEVKSIPSNEMSLADMADIAQAIEAEIDQGAQGIVLTHGTDTMEETSYFVDLLLDTPVPVVFTGSQLSSQDLGYDGFSNIRDAVLTAASDASAGKGTLLVFNQCIFTVNDVVKNNSIGLHAFESVNAGPLGVTYGGRVHYFRDYHPVDKFPVHLEQSFSPNVYLVKASLDFNPKMITALVEAGAEGFVLEGFGVGSLPPALQDILEQVIQAEIPVVLVAKANRGGIHKVYASMGAAIQLEQVGVILDQGYLNGQHARLKLIAMLNSPLKDDIAGNWNKY
ncbi:asparaginase [Aerococcus urinae]|uniref:asparaginase n=1 Tax=Aerococcus urinae TaxID=1376 RepID=UPI00254BD264|nr:asparaginase [Aerococcus urinae]MDK6626781.1 asparaginase [Aerococcus urinae]